MLYANHQLKEYFPLHKVRWELRTLNSSKNYRGSVVLLLKVPVNNEDKEFENQFLELSDQSSLTIDQVKYSFLERLDKLCGLVKVFLQHASVQAHPIVYIRFE